MRKGTFVINPYVSKDFFGKPNPNYRTIYLKKSDKYAKCLAYDGTIISYYYEDVITWETDGFIDLKSELQRWFSVKEKETICAATGLPCSDCQPVCGLRLEDDGK